MTQRLDAVGLSGYEPELLHMASSWPCASSQHGGRGVGLLVPLCRGCRHEHLPVDRSGTALPLMTQSQKSHGILSSPFFCSKPSQVLLVSRVGHKLHLLMGEMSKDLWPFFKNYQKWGKGSFCFHRFGNSDARGQELHQLGPHS